MGSYTILQRTTAQSISNSAWVAASWSSALVDPLGAWSSGSPTIVTVPSGITGVECLLYAAWASSSTGDRCVRLSLNGTVIDANYVMKSDGNSGSHTSTRRYAVSAGNTLMWEVIQFSGGALNFYDSTQGYTPYAQFKWIA